jgi:hypothetical protein
LAIQGLYAAHLSLLKRKDKATHVCLERAMFWVQDGGSAWLLGYEGPVHINTCGKVHARIQQRYMMHLFDMRAPVPGSLEY